MNKTALQLQEHILSLIGRGVGQPTSDGEFNTLARAIFALQYEHCAVYRAYCDQQKRTPNTVDHWKQIPAVPTSAFKQFALTSFPAGDAVAEFHTSGTTAAKSGKHYFPTLKLYDAAIVPNFAAHLLPDVGVAVGNRGLGEENGAPRLASAATGQLPMLILTPSPDEAPHSSLAHMMGVVVKKFGAVGSGFFVEQGVVCVERLTRALRESEQARQPVFLLGTAFAFVHFFEQCDKENLKFALADGSRAMETGGFKARTREVPKQDLYGMFDRFLGIPPTRVASEYGMTELSTQFYDQTLREGRQTDRKLSPPWSRVLVLDPSTGRKAAPGDQGLIRVYDLANLWSMMCIQTEDLGLVNDNGFEILGRATGVEPRGCSLNAESFSPR